MSTELWVFFPLSFSFFIFKIIKSLYSRIGTGGAFRFQTEYKLK